MTTKAEEALAFDSEHRLRSENLSFDIDTWYPKLKKFTFDSLFIPLKREEAEAIRAFHDVSWRNCQNRPYLTRKEITLLKDLESTIQQEIENLWTAYELKLGRAYNGPKAVFLRLCGRSPKDGEPYNRENVFKDYEAILQELLEKERLEDTPNTKMIAISRTQYLKVYNAKDAMSLLLTSERVYAEMIDWLRYGEPEQICLRIFDHDVRLDYEFRVFVCQGRLTAITQYDHYTYYPYLYKEKEMLKKGLFNYWKNIHPFINRSDSSYVIDIAYLKSSNVFQLVELSPFTPCTGPALFHWQFDKDILEGLYLQDFFSTSLQGDSHTINEEEYICRIEFRLKAKEDIHPNLVDLIEINWNLRWREEKVRFDEFFCVSAEDIVEQQQESEAERQSSLLTRLYRAIISKPTTSTKLADANPDRGYHYLFVYGTLKRGFHWHDKYLHSRLGAKYISCAVTAQKYALVVGDSGVPYLLGDVKDSRLANTYEGTDLKDPCVDNQYPIHLSDRCNPINGELFQIDDYCLSGLDDYEGLTKGYYDRIAIPILINKFDLQPLISNEISANNHESPTVDGLDAIPADKKVIIAFVYLLKQSPEDLIAKEYIPEYTIEIHERDYQPIQHIQVKQMNYVKTPSTWGKTNNISENYITKVDH